MYGNYRIMKNSIVLIAVFFASFGLFAQEKGKLNKTLKKTSKELVKPSVKIESPAPPPPKVNKATESNRKRPGGTINNNTNSKTVPVPANAPKKEGKKD